MEKREQKTIKKGVAAFIKAYHDFRFLKFRYINKRADYVFWKFLEYGYIPQGSRLIDHFPGNNEKEYQIKFSLPRHLSQRSDGAPEVCTFPTSLLWSEDDVIQVWVQGQLNPDPLKAL